MNLEEETKKTIIESFKNDPKVKPGWVWTNVREVKLCVWDKRKIKQPIHVVDWKNNEVWR